jgi:hypothetical protein
VDKSPDRTNARKAALTEQKEPFVQSPFLSPPFQLAVDPLLLVMAGRPPIDSARELGEALPALNAAWLSASHILSAGRTGAALRDCSPALQGALAACVTELGGISAALESAAAVYGQADSAAVPAPR